MLDGSFEEIFDATFPKTQASEPDRLTDRLTIPLSAEYKLKYEQVQSATKQKFIDTVRAVVMATIDAGCKRIT